MKRHAIVETHRVNPLLAQQGLSLVAIIGFGGATAMLFSVSAHP